MPSSASMRRTQWTEPGASTALCLLSIESHKSTGRTRHLPSALISEALAPFLHFDAPIPDQLYVVGGRNQMQEPLDTVEMFDSWHGKWVECPPMLKSRAGCAAAALPDGRLLVVGGYDQGGIVTGVLKSCEVFDPAKQEWDPNFPELDRSRWGHGCVTLDGMVYAVGGCALRPSMPAAEDWMETLCSCEVFDPQVGAWAQCPRLQTARAGARLVVLGQHQFAAVGGCDDVFGRAEMLSSVELYDTRTRVWTLLHAKLGVPRTTAAAVALDERQILVMGGAPSLASAEVYRVPRVPDAAAAPRRDPESEGCVEESPAASAAEVQAPAAEVEVALPKEVQDMAEGRMGCQAVSMKLPAPGKEYPLCTRQCVVVVGGENGDEDWESESPLVRQFNHILCFDAEAGAWRSDNVVPVIPTPRTAMALCLAPGRVSGHTS